MDFDSRQWLDRYQPVRRTFEVGAWVVFYCLQALANSVTVQMDIDRVELEGFLPWEPWVWEWSSNMMLLALVPLFLVFDRRFPLAFGQLRRSIPAHLAASVVFSVLHVTAMVAIRKAVYIANGGVYDFGNLGAEYFYEFLEDFRSYGGMLATVYLYRFVLLRMQGEARLLDAPPVDAPAANDPPLPEPVPDRPDRFLVRMLGKEFLLAAADIECLQASGNYVNLRVRGRDYPLRSTLAALVPRLDPARFVRVHRSWLVNLDFLAEIEPLETGDARLTMRDGTKVPCSRTYRAALRGGVVSADPVREASAAGA
jgi:LytTr DNA-binding domain